MSHRGSVQEERTRLRYIQLNMEETQAPRVTILVVARNSAGVLPACLQSLSVSAGRESYEILVVDDGSTDGTSEVTAGFASVISLRLPKRMGWTRAVNIGLRTAKGDLALLTTPEWRFSSNAVARLADRLEGSADVGAVCPRLDHVWHFPLPEGIAQAWRTGKLPGSYAPGEGEAAIDYPNHAPIIVRRELLRAMNYLDSRFGHAWSDLEMCWRIRSGGKSILTLQDVRIDHEAAGNSREEELIDWVDSAHGAATWIRLHHGMAASLRFRVSAALNALAKGHLSAVTGILSGAKIDGNQD